MRRTKLISILFPVACFLTACTGGPPPPTHLSVLASPASVTAGTAINVTVSAVDASGAAVSSFSGTVHFTSTDAQAMLPNDSTLTSGTGSFSVTLKTSGSQTITASGSTISGSSSAIAVAPAAPAKLSVPPPSATPVAGTPFNITVNAADAYSNTVTSYSGTVHFTSSDPQAALPKDSPLTNGTGSFSMTFKTAGGQTVTVSDSANVLTAATSSPITVNSAAVATFSVIAPSGVTTGLPFTITVSAVDTFANVVTNYAGTVHFSLSMPDPQATLPADSSLTNGTKTFSGVILKAIGSQIIRGTDTVTSSITGGCNSIKVVTNAATHLSVTGPASAKTRATFKFTVAALDGANNTSTGYAGTVHFSSSDAQAMLPANSTLASGTANFSATLETAGTQSVTATDTGTATIAGSLSSINVTASPALAISSGAPPNGTVGVNYGPSTVLRCFWTHTIFGWRLTCSPCIPSTSCAPLPVCTPAHISPCKELRFNGFTFIATGGVSPYTWSATGMPPGLSVNPTNGEILGTPTMPNPYNIIVSVTDSGVPPATPVNANYTITIAKPPIPVVNATLVPPPGVVNQPYTYTFTASGYPPLTWSESGALSTGLALNSSTGVLSGTPTVANSYPILVTATDQFNQNSTAAPFTIVVSLHGFQATGNMISARDLQTATLLGSGKVLVTGGQLGTAQLLNTAELFDPSTGTFAATTGNMQVSRSAHTATLLGTSATSKVLVAGGQTASAGNATATAELYDPTAGSFSATTGNLQTARYGHTATLLATGPNAGKVLIIGGKDANGTALATAELYDPAASTFSSTGSMLSARSGHTATLLSSGKVLVIGGTDATPKNLATAELYDPVAGTFTAVAGMMTVTRTAHTATLFTTGPDSGKVLIAGGLDDTGKARNTAELFDPTGGNFTATTTMVSAHASHTATLLNDGTVLVAGGIDATGTVIAEAEIFNSSTGNFTATGSLVGAREQHTATLLPNGRVLVTGGLDASALATAELYQ